mmetsp:Transcript_4857/g.8390  ORF Transcript_4857/g.8390 Transcript_4857/m.8390 type:complete len:213 (+) Transcript_4857:105-743(+)
MGSVNLFAQERSLLMRERAKGMYQVGAYMLAKTMSDMVNTVLMPLVGFGTTVYWLGGLRASFEAFATYLVIFATMLTVAHSLGLTLSIVINNVAIAMALAPVISVMLMILGGFYIPFSHIPDSVYWLSYLSFARYAFTAFCINEYRGKSYPCGDDPDGRECPTEGDVYLAEERDIPDSDSLWGSIAVLVGMQVGFRVISYLVLRFVHKQQRQ